MELSIGKSGNLSVCPSRVPPLPFVGVATRNCSSTCFESEARIAGKRTERRESPYSSERADAAWDWHQRNVGSNRDIRNASMSWGTRRSNRAMRCTTVEWSSFDVYAIAVIDQCDTYANRYAEEGQYWTWQWSHWATPDVQQSPTYTKMYGLASGREPHKSSRYCHINSYTVERNQSRRSRSDNTASIRWEESNEWTNVSFSWPPIDHEK